MSLHLLEQRHEEGFLEFLRPALGHLDGDMDEGIVLGAVGDHIVFETDGAHADAADREHPIRSAQLLGDTSEALDRKIEQGQPVE